MKRREVIKKLAISSGALATVSGISMAASSDITEDEKVIGYAFLGLGSYAAYVLPRLKNCEKSRVVALISSDPEKAKLWKSKYQLNTCDIYTYDDFEKIKKNKRIHAIYIASPVGTHAFYALKAFEAGKHVLTEKTMAANVAQAKEMVDASRKANKKLMVGYRARYEPYNQACIQFAKEETYGKITSIAAHKGFAIGNNFGKGNWRLNKDLSGGGALVDIGIYSIQACRYLAGTEPIEVSALQLDPSFNPKFKDVEAHIVFHLRFPNGILATGSAAWNYSLQNYFRAGTSNGYFELEPATSNMNLRMFVKQENPTRIGEVFYPSIDQIPVMFDHFSTCILEDSEPLTNGEEGIKDLKVIEAIYTSVKENRPVQI
jgi:predicted dehydrogenase